jgi:hypothetical protein
MATSGATFPSMQVHQGFRAAATIYRTLNRLQTTEGIAEGTVAKFFLEEFYSSQTYF